MSQTQSQEADTSEEPPLPHVDCPCHNHNHNHNQNNTNNTNITNNNVDNNHNHNLECHLEACQHHMREQGTSPPPPKRSAPSTDVDNMDFSFVPFPPESINSNKKTRQFINLPPQHAMLPANHHHHHRHATQIQLPALQTPLLQMSSSPRTSSLSASASASASSVPTPSSASASVSSALNYKSSLAALSSQNRPQSAAALSSPSSPGASKSMETIAKAVAGMVGFPSLSSLSESPAFASSLLGIRLPALRTQAEDLLEETQRALDGTKPFALKTYELVNDPNSQNYVGWSRSPEKNSFVIYDLANFSSIVLPKYFKHNNFSSFVRQLNTYGFRKIESTEGICFQHENFKPNCPHLLKYIQRKKPGSSLLAGKKVSPQSGAGVGAANFGGETGVGTLGFSSSSSSPGSVPSCEAAIGQLRYEMEELKKQQAACISAIEDFQAFVEESKERDEYIFQRLLEITNFICNPYYDPFQEQQQDPLQQQQQPPQQGQEQEQDYQELSQRDGNGNGSNSNGNDNGSGSSMYVHCEEFNQWPSANKYNNDNKFS